MRDRIVALEDGQTRLLGDVATIMKTIGKPPDPLAADEESRRGSGLTGITYRMASVVLRGEDAPVEDGEITRVQSREELIARAKAAEAALRDRDRISIERRNTNIKMVSTIVGAVIAVASIAANAYLLSRGAPPIAAPQTQQQVRP
jgi:hypothetical protein